MTSPEIFRNSFSHQRSFLFTFLFALTAMLNVSTSLKFDKHVFVYVDISAKSTHEEFVKSRSRKREIINKSAQRTSTAFGQKSKQIRPSIKFKSLVCEYARARESMDCNATFNRLEKSFARVDQAGTIIFSVHRDIFLRFIRWKRAAEAFKRTNSSTNYASKYAKKLDGFSLVVERETKTVLFSVYSSTSINHRIES